MNPINDEVQTKDSIDAQNLTVVNNSTTLSQKSNERFEKTQMDELYNQEREKKDTKVDQSENIKLDKNKDDQENKKNEKLGEDSKANVEKSSETKVSVKENTYERKEQIPKNEDKSEEEQDDEKSSESKVNEYENIHERKEEIQKNEESCGSKVNDKEDIHERKEDIQKNEETSDEESKANLDDKESCESKVNDMEDIHERKEESNKQEEKSLDDEESCESKVNEKEDIDERKEEIKKNEEKPDKESKTNQDDEKSLESKVNEENTSKIENTEQPTENEVKTNEEDNARLAEIKDPASVVSGTTDEDIDEFEDVEIPGEGEVDEIIVPDEAEAEDLTDGKDNEELIDEEYEEREREEKEDQELDEEKQEDCGAEEEDIGERDEDCGAEEEDGEEREKEEESSKDSEMERSDINEEDTSKSCEATENYEFNSEKLLHDTTEDNSAKDYEGSDIEGSPIEPELIALEEGEIKNADSRSDDPKSNERNIDEDTNSQATYDPLNCLDNKAQDEADDDIVKNIEKENSSENQKLENEVTVNEDDDDEVQFVETRNSPICIESDDDDCNLKVITETPSSSGIMSKKNETSKQIQTNEITVVTGPKTATRTSARKSTAKPQQNQTSRNKSPAIVPQVQNKSKHNNFIQKASIQNRRFLRDTSTQRIVDCIELLDSSDEESVASRNRSSQQQKAPQKRTLLGARGNYYKNNNKPTAVANRLPNNFSPQVRQQPKKPAPPPLPPPTPQSNFLNAVQLQPASVTGPNPPAFSALLSNKNVIIPNAFYGNPPNVRVNPDNEIERRYARWLDNFLNQFCKPQFVATHSCLVFLQRALKYKDFVRIKALRANMTSQAQNPNNQLNTQLMTDLKTIFLKNSKKITNYGRRFCELTCSAVPGKTVALMSHGISGKVTLKTCNMDLPKSTNSTISSPSSSSYPSTNTVTRKRQLDEDEDEYTPDKSKLKTKAMSPSENGDEDSNETSDDRKRSLRTKRTKRIDNSFSYNEDDLLAEYEIDDEDDEKLAQMEVQRKIDEKRLEAQKQRQQQVKSFESAFIQAFARTADTPATYSKATKNPSAQRIRLNNTTTATATCIRQYTVNNDAEDLLQATWIENFENDEAQVISDDDEPKEHRIYKQQQHQQEQQEEFQEQDQEYYTPSTRLSNRQNSTPKYATRSAKKNQDEVITGDDDYEENNYSANNPPNVNSLYWPKNVDSQMYVNGKFRDRCVICNLSCQRLVHHYVNEHRGCEVYNSRLSSSQLRLLKQGRCTVTDISQYKNGQFQYEAFCIFCQKQSRFMLPYWYQHFTMHTGEYAYRCIGCGIRKPTRSLLTQHQAQGCPEVGGVAQDYAHDPKSSQIEAKICNLCNYVQLHRSNIVKHLHTQHNIKQILPKYIQTIVLMKTPVNMSAATTSSPSSSVRSAATKHYNTRPTSSHVANTYVIESADDEFTYEEILPEDSQHPTETTNENNYYNYIPPYMQAAINSGSFSFENVEAGDDLSFMICGMLDVDMNTDAN